eukprot:TRINITY_DN4779_c0_g1_i3.p1 TRINITY_DN4779_c0_g1~~TRINITY_DN4779_c0_g1_i3.p1  ORF type:complete len:507 (-),score=93.20 TRINITY_DN4779_c0_g1_i3:104-1594(-)
MERPAPPASRGGYSGTRAGGSAPAAGWACPSCTFANAAVAEQCEVCLASRPGSWSCTGCTLLNGQHAEICACCGEPRPSRKGRPSKQGDFQWRSAQHLLNMRPSAPAASARRPPPQRRPPQQVAAAKPGNFVRGSCRLVLDPRSMSPGKTTTADHAAWDKVWRVDMPCEEPPACPICLEVPSLPRVPLCGHAICLVCALRHMQAAASSQSSCNCPVCGKGPVLLADLRPVRLEVLSPPRPDGSRGLVFQLVRRTGQAHLGLAAEHFSASSSSLAREGEPGWHFARRVLGDPEVRLDLLHSELRALEAASEDAGGTELLEPALALLREELRTTNAAAAAVGGAETQRTTNAAAAAVGGAETQRTTNAAAAAVGGAETQRMASEGDSNVIVFYQSEEERITDWLLKRHKFLGHLPAEAAGSLVHFAHGVLDVGEPRTVLPYKPKSRSRRQGAGLHQKTSEAQDAEEIPTAKQPSATGSWDKMASPLEDAVQDAWSEED